MNKGIEVYKNDIQLLSNAFCGWEQLDKKTMLITGATGMIASAIIDIIIYRNEKFNQNTKIIAVSRNEQKARERFEAYWNSPYFSYISHDITRTLPNIEKVDYILHAASNTHPRAYATEPVQTITTNVLGTYELLNYVAEFGCERFLCFSSVEIYGENRNDVDKFDESYLGYMDCNTVRAGYPEAKRISESLCNAFAAQIGLDFVIGRFSRVYGPTMGKDDSKAIAQFINKAVKGENIVLKSEGTQLYSYTYVLDAAMAALYLLVYGKNGEAYNVSDERSEITLKELAQILADEAGSHVVFQLPDVVEKAGYSTATKALLDNSKIKKIGWSAKIPIKEGLTKTVRTLREIN